MSFISHSMLSVCYLNSSPILCLRHFHPFSLPLPQLSVAFLIWNYYVTMPMPASTFTLAVGHWHQVRAEIPPALEEGVRDRTSCGKTAKLGAVPGEWAEEGLGSSTSEVVKGSPLKTWRYFIIFPVFFSSCKTSSSPDCY